MLLKSYISMKIYKYDFITVESAEARMICIHNKTQYRSIPIISMHWKVEIKKVKIQHAMKWMNTCLDIRKKKIWNPNEPLPSNGVQTLTYMYRY